jgi:hypothetical protein
MIDFAQLQADLTGWVRTASGLDVNHVIPQNDGGPRPSGQYATVRVFDPVKIGHDPYSMTTNLLDDTSVDINYSGLRQIMVGINVYRGDALGAMEKLKSSLDRVTIQDYFRAKDIGIINTSETRDLSEVVNGSYEERRQTDFFFFVTNNDTETVEAIETVKGTNMIDGSSYTVTSV